MRKVVKWIPILGIVLAFRDVEVCRDMSMLGSIGSSLFQAISLATLIHLII